MMTTTESSSPRPCYTPAEVAQILRVSMRSMYRWIREDRIHTIRLGTDHRIPATEMDRILSEGLSPDRAANHILHRRRPGRRRPAWHE